jgi:ribosome maturation factor RimP
MTTKETAIADHVRGLAEPLAGTLGVEVLEVRVSGPSGRRLLRVTIDLIDLDADEGVDIDTIATLTRQLNDALDEVDPVPGRYTLEVTSPGADQPLVRARDFARNRGREVKVAVTDASADDAAEPVEHTGVVVAVTDTDLTLDIDDTELVVPLGTIEQARVVLPW